MSADAKRVLITGFGPSKVLEKNPSWLGVNCLNKDEIERKYNIHLYPEQIEVQYSKVDESVPKLWAKLQPDLTIHVGAKDEINCFLLETQACKERYEGYDELGTCPAENKHTCDGPETLSTDLDVDGVCNQFSSDPPHEMLKAEKSCDAGKYLCEYIYYTSLNCRGASKTLFVHVPLHEDFTPELIAQGLERILQICLEQI